MAKSTYTLAWPRPLFDREAARVAELGNDLIVDAVVLLITEAFADEHEHEHALAELVEVTASSIWEPDVGGPRAAREWLAEVRVSELAPHRPPVYYAEREGLVPDGPPGDWLSLGQAFAELIATMQGAGYLPYALPRECVDRDVDYIEVTRRIRQATKLQVNWPLPTPATLPDATIFTLIEYFHDQAYRPRTKGFIHSHAECGPHYDAHNRDSGGFVYRWRVNQLLSAHGVGFRLGTTGEELGRLIREFDTPIGDLADRQIERRQTTPNDEVGHAIREFRKRDAGLPQKRAAIRALSHSLEPRRKELGERLTKKDESDLFQIVNQFGIRHNRDGQRHDYGDEFLDWIFWMHLATIDFLNQLDAREGTS